MDSLILELLILLLHSMFLIELKLLSSFAITQSHAAYSAFTHGLVSKWLFTGRTVPNVDDSSN